MRDPAQIKWAKPSGELNPPTYTAWSWGGVTMNNHETIAICQTEVPNPGFEDAILAIDWDSVIEAKWLQTGNPVARPEEK
jgi:hypothetical protein